MVPTELFRLSDGLSNWLFCRSDISRVQLKSNWKVGERLVSSDEGSIMNSYLVQANFTETTMIFFQCLISKLIHLEKNFSNAVLKGYLPTKVFFDVKWPLMYNQWFFFIWRKNSVLFSRYLDFSVVVKSTNCKICDVTIDMRIKMKFGLILVYLITNISNLFLAQCWGQETNFRPFYDFNEMAI